MLHVEQSAQRFEEDSIANAQRFEKLIDKKLEDLHFRITAVSCQVERLENQMETELRLLFHGMYKTQGKLQDDESDDDWKERKCFVDELPGYADETMGDEAEIESLKTRRDPSSQVSGTENENEQSFVRISLL